MKPKTWIDHILNKGSVEHIDSLGEEHNRNHMQFIEETFTGRCSMTTVQYSSSMAFDGAYVIDTRPVQIEDIGTGRISERGLWSREVLSDNERSDTTGTRTAQTANIGQIRALYHQLQRPVFDDKAGKDRAGS